MPERQRVREAGDCTEPCKIMLTVCDQCARQSLKDNRLFCRVCGQLSPSQLHAVACTCQFPRTQLVESARFTSEAGPCRPTPAPPLFVESLPVD